MPTYVFSEKKLEMSDEEMGRIALVLVRNAFRERGFRLKPGILREIGEKAKELGIPFERARVFAEILSYEIFEEIFPRKK